MSAESKTWFAELLGTWILVFIGISSVGAAVIWQVLDSLWQVALLWTLGVSLGIILASRWGPAHLNPAVSLAMFISDGIPLRTVLSYVTAQLSGALLAGLSALWLFLPGIEKFEKDLLLLDAGLYHFVGPFRSMESAQMFGEFFPNPSYANQLQITWWQAAGVEALATFLLLLGIYYLCGQSWSKRWLPWSIGIWVGLLILCFAPFTQCGMNPARDFGPRLIAYLAGWGTASLPEPHHAALTVYVLAPLLGASFAAFLVKGWRARP